jgi:DNA/RNA-binding domain of Phe-tRNA-synthetase-like protein
MIVVRIQGWRDCWRGGPEANWWAKEFASRLLRDTDLQKPECEALAKRVLRDRECCEIPLAKVHDRYGATSLRSLLDSFGADTTIDELPLSRV